MRKLLIATVVSFFTMSMLAGLVQSAGLCPSGFQVVYDINKPFCVASFSFEGGSCPSGSQLLTMNGKPLCLRSQSPTEGDTPASRIESEPGPTNPRLIPH
jgi:hypothetical protein